MQPKFILQLHVHSNKSHDSKISIEQFVKFFEKTLQVDEYGVLGITDHNCLPISTATALNFSTRKVLVVPGIQWKLHKTLGTALKKFITRRELITLGDHDGLGEYIKSNTAYQIAQNQEILGNFTEQNFLNYVKEKDNLILIVPHPRHFFFDYYGPIEIEVLTEKIKRTKVPIPVFVEAKTGYDPFPRILYRYEGRYQIIGSSDAHELKSIFGTNSFSAVETSILGDAAILQNWQNAMEQKDLGAYKRVIKDVFVLLKQKNNEIRIKKHYGRSIIHFMGSIPRFLVRRFSDFPRNLLK